KEVKRLTSADGNELLALFLRPPRPDGLHDLSRQFSINADREAAGKDFTRADFEAGKRSFDRQRARLEENARQTTGVQKVTLEPVHDPSDRHFSIVMHSFTPDGKE